MRQTMIALLAGAAAISAATTAEVKPEATPSAPQFPRRWWHSRTRIDIRPVLWSLRNHPDEWNRDCSSCTIVHTPSQHEFWINGFWFYSLYSANGCSCTRLREGRFSFLQKLQFAGAFRHWRVHHDASVTAARVETINKQFAEHFLK